MIRRWATDTRLNGRDFSDAELAPGDRLSIGPIELEVLHTSWLCGDPSAEFDPQNASVRQEKLDPSSACPKIDSEIASQQDHSLAEYQLQFDRARAALEAREQVLSDQRRKCDSQWAKRERELKLRAEELDAREAELEARSEALPQRQQPRQAEQPPSGSREDRPAEHDRQAEPGFRQLDDDSPVNTAAVFRRMDNVSLPEEEYEEERLPEAPAADTAELTQESQPVLETGRQDDESIDEYMSRLLDRVRSATDGSPEPRPAPRSPLPAPAPPVRQPVQAPKDIPPAAASPPPERPVKELPRAKTTEQTVDLRAMRELANLSACNAIERYTHRTLIHDRSSRLLMAIVGLVAGGALIWIWWFRLTSELTLSAGLVALVIALLWSVQYVVLTGRVIVNKSRRRRQAACESDLEADDEPQAADDSPPEEDAQQQ